MDERYRVYITPSARREAKRFPKRIKDAILEASDVLARDPLAGERLTGSIRMLYSFHFTVGESQYRVAYSLDYPHQGVIVHLIHSRENFYEKLKRIFH
jgi:mRNA-degrading endonuclease RelE of RelBE toxin-antitoxin system